MGMKILIFLSLAAIGLAKRHNQDRRAFLFPGQPSSGKDSHTLVWSEFGNLGSLNPDINSNEEKPSDDLNIVLRNPNRRDVKLGQGFPAFGFHDDLKLAQSQNDITDDLQLSLNAKNKPPRTKLGYPSFIANNAPVLQKEDSSSSEETTAPANNQEEPSSSEESNAPANKQEESSSSEESNAPASQQEKSTSSEESNEPIINQDESSSSDTPAIKQDESSANEESNAPSSRQAESSSNAPARKDSEEKNVGLASSEDSQYARVFNEKQDPFIGANLLTRSLVLKLRDVDGRRPVPARKAHVPGSRALREAQNNFPDLGIQLSNGGNRNIQVPQGRIGGSRKQNYRVRRPTK